MFNVYYTLGDCYYNLYNYAEAIKRYNKALENIVDKTKRNEILKKLTICYINTV